MECAVLADYQYLNHIHMTQKDLYTSPEVVVLTLQSEGVVCQSGPWGDPNAPGSVLIEDPSFTFDF